MFKKLSMIPKMLLLNPNDKGLIFYSLSIKFIINNYKWKENPNI